MYQILKIKVFNTVATNMKGITIALRVYKGQMVHGPAVLLTEWTFRHQKIQSSLRVKGLLSLLDNPTIQPSKDSSIQLPKSKGLLGLLDGTSPTIQ
ncbi:MAG: hypothetical protein ACM3VV_07915 [Deltaproteobacteria bacterium]